MSHVPLPSVPSLLSGMNRPTDSPLRYLLARTASEGKEGREGKGATDAAQIDADSVRRWTLYAFLIVVERFGRWKGAAMLQFCGSRHMKFIIFVALLPVTGTSKIPKI